MRQTLSLEAVEKFKAIYEKEFGCALSDDEAHEAALSVLNLFRILIYPGSDAGYGDFELSH